MSDNIYDNKLPSLPAHFFAILNVLPAFVYNSAASSVLDEPLKIHIIELTQSQLQL